MGKIYFLAVAAFCVMFAACGDDITEIHQDGVSVLAKGEKLSKQVCDSTNVGELLFVTDSSEVFFCDGESWGRLKGADGKDGKDGANGKNGADGKDGKDGKNGADGKDGKDGANGKNGADGEDGEDGESLIAYPGVMGHFIDNRDGHVYKTVVIGTQTWMAENLNYAYTGVPYNYSDSTSDSTSWCYDNKPDNCTKYGRLYTWAAAIDSVALAKDTANPQTCGFGADKCVLPTVVRGVCPEGWRLPSDDEWKALITAVGKTDIAGKMLKSADGWNDNKESSGNGLDAYGFSALPAGSRGYDGKYNNAGDIALFWSASEHSGLAGFLDLYYDFNFANLLTGPKYSAHSVRCLKD